MVAPVNKQQVQGQTVTSADWFNTQNQSTATFATLRQFTGVDGMSVYVVGARSANDGGQGYFYWKGDATQRDDNGATCIQATGGMAQGRWLRVGEPFATGFVVTTWNGRWGDVTFTLDDLEAVGGMGADSPAFTGTPTAPTAPPGTDTTQLATTAFVEQEIANLGGGGGGGGASIVIGPTPPTTPVSGAMWWDSVNGSLYIYYNDGTSSQWVPAVNQPGTSALGINSGPTPPPSPTDNSMWWDSVGGQLYIYYDDGNSQQWVLTSNLAQQMPLSIAGGGTGQTSAAAALAALGGQPSTGVINGVNAAAGQVGELLNSTVTTGVPIATSGTAINVTSLALTAGDWDVRGEVWIAIGTGGATALHAGISSTSATLPAAPSGNAARQSFVAAFTASNTACLDLRSFQLNVSAPTTVYLIANAAFPSGSVTATGSISARRMR